MLRYGPSVPLCLCGRFCGLVQILPAYLALGTNMDGWVAPAKRTGALLARNCISSCKTPAKRASPVQAAAHAGTLPCFTLSRQRLHFCIFPSAPYCGTPNGQALEQERQPIHFSESTRTIPLSRRLVIAPEGHTASQAGLPQCIQERDWLERRTFGHSPVSTVVTRRQKISPPGLVSFQSLQATTQELQPIHRPASK